MDLYAVADLTFIILAFTVFMIRRNATASFLFFEWVISITLATLMYKLSVDSVFRFVVGPLTPIFLFLIFSLYFKVKPVKQLLYTYMVFWGVSFTNYLSYPPLKEIVNEYLMIDLNWFMPDTYFVLTVTIMLIQLYIAYKLDRRGSGRRNDRHNLIHCNSNLYSLRDKRLQS